jgi:predicted RNase H-like nuclease (RuvC/YqgF family)
MALDWQSIGAAASAVVAIATGAWAWWLKNKRQVAETKAEVAVADGQQTVYKLMDDRLKTMEADIKDLRAELAEERRHSRDLERKLSMLDAWIRAQGLTPPSL